MPGVGPGYGHEVVRTGVGWSVAATAAERAEPRPGDQVVDSPTVVMDRAFSVPVAPDLVWPWLMQLGKRRAGWYLPRGVERFLPAGRRAVRHLDDRWQDLRVGSVIPDYGGRDETFTVLDVDAPRHLVYGSQRGRTHLTWSITLRPIPATAGTRILMRLRLAPVTHVWLARTAGEAVDVLTIAGLRRGLLERLGTPDTPETAR
ncbi:hypothetical protein [Williamsia sterculiae]|uniref:hypothetical protein n=1 Tax=Williamsia sterculiae TaxID=1344003 RepID=UPI00190E6C6F|nr:hypothetical protein [Williamsia sterculiae]